MKRPTWILRASVALIFPLSLWSCAELRAEETTSEIIRVNYTPKQSEETGGKKKPSSKYRGWDYLVQKLRADGIKESEIAAIYRSPRMPRFTSVTFNLNPKESSALYSRFTEPKKIGAALDFLATYEKAFAKAEKKYGVEREIVAALLLIESHFGKITGTQMVVNRLSRVASVRDPANLRENYERLHKEDPTITFKEVEKRARYLEDTFYPEIPALISIGRRNKINVLNVKGSSAGAFGFPQFLPSSYVKFAVDGNGDGVVSLYNEADAILSVANFLHKFGWKDGISTEQKRKVIWHYNHSDPYIEAALDVADELSEKQEEE